MDPQRLTYIPVYCYIEPEQVSAPISSEEAEKFVVRLEASLRKIAREDTRQLRDIVQEVVIPHYTAFLEVGKLLCEAGVKVAATMHWSFPGVISVPQEEIIRRIPAASLMYENSEYFRKTGRAVIKGNAHLLVELIPDHPLLCERQNLLKLPAGSVELPLIICDDPFEEFKQRRYLQLSVPEELGTYDLDEAQMKLTKQLGQALPQLAGKVYTHVNQLLVQKDPSTTLVTVGTAADSVLAGWQTASRVVIDSQAKDVLIQRIKSFESLIAEEAKSIQELVTFSEGILSNLLTLQITADVEGHPQVLLTNLSTIPSHLVRILLLDGTGGQLDGISVPSLQPLDSVVVLNVEQLAMVLGSGARQICVGSSTLPLPTHLN